MKRFEISYNPYINRIYFRQCVKQASGEECTWTELESDSVFLKYQNQRCIFENCVEEIIELINKYMNTSGELLIDFSGTMEDFAALQQALKNSSSPKSKGISCKLTNQYPSSSDVLSEIRNAYQQIKTEFSDYIGSNDLEANDDRAVIGNAITRFQETVKAEIPVCVIGNYSVGKSALVNALVGMEILPSHANSTTAKNVLIKNSKNYYMQFRYENTEYRIEVHGTVLDVICNGEKDEDLIGALTDKTFGLASEEAILHQIIENVNTETSTDSKVSKIESNITIFAPFKNSELDTDKYSFVFIDTPGSNNSDEAQVIHRENLEKLLDEQTNALPVFVMSRNSIDSNDANDLRTLLEHKEAGFALQNCIIVISMSDQLVEQQLSEEMPEKIKQWLNHPTIMYVSPVAAIGEKKGKDKYWVDPTYRQLFEKKMNDLVDVNPPKYNETPCNRCMDDDRIRAISAMLYASGVPSLETEINYYAYRFAEYKKCINGREYLLEALRLADDRLSQAQDQLEKDKNEKVKEQKTIRLNIEKNIENIKLPSVNIVIHSVNSTFNKTLNAYCATVEEVVRIAWQKNNHDIEAFEKAMQNHCQTHLYNAQIKNIKECIETRFVELTAEYMTKVKACVTDQYAKFSGAAQQELNQFFGEHENGPTLQDVSAKGFERIKFQLLGRIPIDRVQDLFIKQYAKTFCKKLQGDAKHCGVFAIDCINNPARQYSKQIVDWSKLFKASIDATLNKDNAILSALDEKIQEMEDHISDLEQRLHNLDEVKAMLEDLLPEERKGDQ